MSGTSCDGLDLALCRFNGEFPQVDFEVLSAHCFEYSAEWREKLQNAMHFSALDLAILEDQWSRKVANNILTFIENAPEKPELIGFHGHTVFHQPQNGFTMQIGSGATLSRLTGIDTICNFRQQDVALGGQGAPLVPMGEKWLFAAYAGFMNLGGFSNVTRRIKQADGSETMIAYDVCALNIVLNKLCGELNLPFDDGGKIAARGIVSSDLLSALNGIKYFQTGEKGSLGLEWVEGEILPIIKEFRASDNLSIEDIISTFTEHCAIQCGKAMPDGRYLLSGGGTHNVTLIDRIRKHSNAQIEIPDNLLNDFKEAVIFAFLAGLRAADLPNTITTVTGASRTGCNGAFYKA